VKLLQLFDILKTYYVFKMSNNTIALRLLHLCGTHREVYLRSPPSVRARVSRDDHRSEDEPSRCRWCRRRTIGDRGRCFSCHSPISWLVVSFTSGLPRNL